MRSENEKLKEIKDIAQGMHDWWTIHDKYIDEANRYIGAEE